MIYRNNHDGKKINKTGRSLALTLYETNVRVRCIKSRKFRHSQLNRVPTR